MTEIIDCTKNDTFSTGVDDEFIKNQKIKKMKTINIWIVFSPNATYRYLLYETEDGEFYTDNFFTNDIISINKEDAQKLIDDTVKNLKLNDVQNSNNS